MGMGADALFGRRYSVFPCDKRECHLVYTIRNAERADGALHLADCLPMGRQTALESVCGRSPHQALVGAGDAGGDGFDSIVTGAFGTTRALHTGTDPLYDHRLLFRHA